jgi:hypothetical protein
MVKIRIMATNYMVARKLVDLTISLWQYTIENQNTLEERRLAHKVLSSVNLGRM